MIAQSRAGGWPGPLVAAGTAERIVHAEHAVLPWLFRDGHRRIDFRRLRIAAVKA